MKEVKDYTVLVQIGSEKPFFQLQLVRDIHGRGYGIIHKQKIPRDFFFFLKKLKTHWLDMKYLPGKLEPGDEDFDDAFTFHSEILSNRLKTYSQIHNFEIRNIDELLQSMNDDERNRYVV